MNKEQIAVSSTGAILIPVFDYFYGTGDAVKTVMAALVFLILLDWISGITAAKKDRSYASNYGIDGVRRTFFILLLPAGGHLLDAAFMLPSIIFGALSVGLIFHTLKSMTANAIRAGWADWLPINAMEWLIKWVGSELDKKFQRAAERGANQDGQGL